MSIFVFNKSYTMTTHKIENRKKGDINSPMQVVVFMGTEKESGGVNEMDISQLICYWILSHQKSEFIPTYCATHHSYFY